VLVSACCSAMAVMRVMACCPRWAAVHVIVSSALPGAGFHVERWPHAAGRYWRLRGDMFHVNGGRIGGHDEAADEGRRG
jgi:hypothetical protein